MPPGSIVQLICGSPPMAVIGRSTDLFGMLTDSLDCVWSVQGATKWGSFVPHVLVLYDPMNPLPSGLGRPKGDPKPEPAA